MAGGFVLGVLELGMDFSEMLNSLAETLQDGAGHAG